MTYTRCNKDRQRESPVSLKPVQLLTWVSCFGSLSLREQKEGDKASPNFIMLSSWKRQELPLRRHSTVVQSELLKFQEKLGEVMMALGERRSLQREVRSKRLYTGTEQIIKNHLLEYQYRTWGGKKGCRKLLTLLLFFAYLTNPCIKQHFGPCLHIVLTLLNYQTTEMNCWVHLKVQILSQNSGTWCYYIQFTIHCRDRWSEWKPAQTWCSTFQYQLSSFATKLHLKS